MQKPHVLSVAEDRRGRTMKRTALMPSLERKSLCYMQGTSCLHPSGRKNKINLNNSHTLQNKKQTNLARVTHISHKRMSNNWIQHNSFKYFKNHMIQKVIQNITSERPLKVSFIKGELHQ